MTVREKSVRLIKEYLPESNDIGYKQVGFHHIAKDYAGGTTCGFLPHWLWWRLGVIKGVKINRAEPDSNLSYTDGQNISYIFNSPAFIKISDSPTKSKGIFETTTTPQVGDTVFITNESGAEHVFIILDILEKTDSNTIKWKIAEGGQGPMSSDDQYAHISVNNVHFGNGKAWVGQRYVVGWLSLDLLSFGSSPVPSPANKMLDLASYTKTETANNRLLFDLTGRSGRGTPQAVWDGVWFVEIGKYQWYYLFYDGHRVFYFRTNWTVQPSGSGYWVTNTRSNNSISILWPTGEKEDWNISRDKKGVNANGTISNGTKISASKVTGRVIFKENKCVGLH